ncbi:DnaJ family molecular chaperone [Micrococcoides hystricis]|uniref:DnaJ family molecular chaperone n=1 Tax=Micrococcoides hystricis TaxID=1572761 RepID=A0ABV6P892_9MICC
MTEAEAYEFFGLSPGADDAQVKKAYRQALRRAHPDAGGSAREFIAVKTAYGALQRARKTASGSEPTQQPASRPSRKRAADGKRSTKPTTIQPTIVGSALLTGLLNEFSFGETYQPGFFGGFSRSRQEQAEVERFTVAALSHRVPRPLPAARLVNSVKLPGTDRIPQVLVSGYRAVLFFPISVPDARYRYQDHALVSERGRIVLPQMAAARRAFEKACPSLNSIARAIAVTAALDSQRPTVSAPAGRGHELVSAANLATAVADAVLFLAEGPQPHTLDTGLIAQLAGIE